MKILSCQEFSQSYILELKKRVLNGHGLQVSSDTFLTWPTASDLTHRAELVSTQGILLKLGATLGTTAYSLSDCEYKTIWEQILAKEQIKVCNALMNADRAELSLQHREHFLRLVNSSIRVDSEGLLFDNNYAMFFAEAELMKRHAELLVGNRDSIDILELGYGLGIFARQAAQQSLRRYVVMELHPVLALEARKLLSRYLHNDCELEVLTLPWQLGLKHVSHFDAVMCDTCPPEGLSESDFEQLVNRIVTSHIRIDGRFSFFWSGELASSHRAKILDKYFNYVEMERFKLKEVPTHWTKETDKFLVTIAKELKNDRSGGRV